MSVVIKNLPLLNLFTRLREAGLPLGIQEYESLLSALQAGFGLPNQGIESIEPADAQAALKQLCKTLWLKSLDDAPVFDYYFSNIMAMPAKGPSFVEKQPSRAQSTPSAPPIEDVDKPVEPIAEPTKLPVEANEPQSTALRSNKPEPAADSGTSPDTTSPESPFKMAEDEIQTTLTVLEATNRDDEIPANRFIMTSDYFPVTKRQMKQSWRYLRRPSRDGPAIELDIDATVREAGRQGVLVEPILVPRRMNRAELLLLIDQNGSMIPFYALSRRLVKTAKRGGRLGWLNTYYFHNCPVDVLYHDPYHSAKEAIPNVLQQLHTKQAAVLIFSDAGAARGGFNRERLQLTNQFLIQLKTRIRSIAWLNPVPSSRWAGTTAAPIAGLVPMFDINRQGFHQAIDVLRGSSTDFVR